MTDVEWRRNPATLWRRTTTGVVLLPPSLQEPVRLAGSAALLWDALEEPTTAADMTELLARACGEDPDRVRADIDDVLEELNAIGAAEVGGTAPC